MRVIFTEDVADDMSGFLGRFVPVVARHIHGVEHPPVHRLQPIADIRQRPPDDHAHRVIQIGAFHLIVDIDRLDDLGHIFPFKTSGCD